MFGVSLKRLKDTRSPRASASVESSPALPGGAGLRPALAPSFTPQRFRGAGLRPALLRHEPLAVLLLPLAIEHDRHLLLRKQSRPHDGVFRGAILTEVDEQRRRRHGAL